MMRVLLPAALAALLAACSATTVVPGEIGDPCEITSDCAQGLVCTPTGICTKPAVATCMVDDQCPGGDCVNGVCVYNVTPQCTLDTDCGPGEKCDAGTCVPTRVEPQCAKDEDCGQGFACKAGTCVGSTASKCAKDEDCDPGYKCIEEECVKDPETPECTKDEDCESGKCDEASGTCEQITPPKDCEADADCKDESDCTVDTCAEGKCSNAFKAGAGCCLTDADCPKVSCNKVTCESQKCAYAPVEDCCIENSECEDGNILTIDTCVDFQCQHDMPECVNDGECDDKNPCSLDYCSNGKCKHDVPPGSGCCTSDADCADGDVNTTDMCIDSQCSHVSSQKCNSDAECVDANPCTTEMCKNGQCSYGAVESQECKCVSNADCTGIKGNTCSVFQTGAISIETFCTNPKGSKKGGQTCAINSECQTNFCMKLQDGSYCFGGCKSDVDCVAGTGCGQVNFGVADGVDVQIPACVPSSPACDGDKDCGVGDVCLPMAKPNTPETLFTACGDAKGTKKGGETCSSDAECGTNICFDLFEKNKNICFSACKADGDCPGGLKCYPNMVFFVFDKNTPAEDDDTYYGVSACADNLGSYKPCWADAECLANEFCYPYPNQSLTTIEPHCVVSFTGGMLNAGASCGMDSQCKSNDCADIGSGGICFGLCQSSGQCAGNTSCKSIDYTLNMATVAVDVCLP